MPDDQILFDVLVDHWLYQVICNHEKKMDTAVCACGEWDSDFQPNVGEAVKKWAEHIREVCRAREAARQLG